VGANADGACAGGWIHLEVLGTSRSRSANEARVKIRLANPGAACPQFASDAKLSLMSDRQTKTKKTSV
jgi:hypothetical protein